MPSRKSEDGSQRDIAHPITKEFRQRLEKEVMDEFYRVNDRAAHGEMAIEDTSMENEMY